MRASNRRRLPVLAVFLFLWAGPVWGAVSFTVSAGAPNVCAGAEAAALGGVALSTSAGGTAPAGSSITIYVTPAAMTATPPLLTGAPPGVTLAVGYNTITISFGGGVVIPAGATLIVSNIIAVIPSNAGPTITANLTFTSGILVTPTSAVIATVGNLGCLGRIASSVATLSIATPQRLNPPSQPVTITNSTRPGVNLSPSFNAVSTPAGWLVVLASTENAGVTTLTVQINSAELLQGTYSGSITLTSAVADNSPQTIPVTLTVGKPGIIRLGTAKMTFLAARGQNPPPQMLRVENAGTGILDPQALVSSFGGSWLSVTPVELEPRDFLVEVDSSTLPIGNYNGSITITSTEAFNSPQSVEVELGVRTPAPTITLSTRSMAFSAEAGGDPQRLAVTIGNSGPGPLVWRAEATTASGGNWIQLGQTTGTAPTAVTISANPAGLAPGTYNGTVTIISSSEGITNSPQTIQVTLTVREPAPRIALSPASLVFRTLPGGAAPAAQTVALTNSGGGTLAFAVTVATFSGGNWLAVSPAEGTAPATLTVTVDTRILAAGRYTGSISVRSTGTTVANSPQTIPVEVNVELPRLNAGGIVNAATGGTSGLSPGSLFTVYGTNLALETRSAGPGSSLPLELGGAILRVGGFRAPLLFASPTQINAQAPVELSESTALVQATVGTHESQALTVSVLAHDPGLFTTTGGPGGAAAALKADFTPINSASPAARGSVIMLFSTGLGPVVPTIASGQFGSGVEPLNRTVQLPEVRIGDRPARVLFSGLAPGFAGLFQVNVEIAADAATGDSVPVILMIGGRSSNTARLAIR